MRVAVHEIEAWIMADVDNFAAFLGVKHQLLPSYPDQVADPKSEIARLARGSSKKAVRANIAPDPTSGAKIGKAYTSEMTRFVEKDWQLDNATQNSASLARAIQRFDEFFSRLSS